MSVDTYEQMSTGVSDITSIAMVTLEIINNSLLINELRLWFVCRELMGNLAARKSVCKHYDNRQPLSNAILFFPSSFRSSQIRKQQKHRRRMTFQHRSIETSE